MLQNCSTPSRWRTAGLEQQALTGLLGTPIPLAYKKDKCAAGHRDTHWGHIGFWSLEPQRRRPGEKAQPTNYGRNHGGAPVVKDY